jgi:CheY-like chemotaxis protein
VEDNDINQMVAREFLAKAGLVVTVATNGLAAVELVQEQDFDLVLMDLQMPVMDGLTAAKRIRALAKPGVDLLPIVAMTANAMEDDIQQCHRAGMNGHVSKPFSPQRLYASLAQWLGGAAAADPAGSGHLPGLDPDQAIRQLGGNEPLYRELLRRFVREYHDGGPRMRASLAHGERNAAMNLAHAIKGVAGVLAAEALRRSAQELEAALKNEAADVEPLAARFAAELETVLASIDGVVGTVEADGGEGDREADEVEELRLSAPQRQELEEALQSCNPAACGAALGSLREEGVETPAALARLGRLVADYRYDEALARVKRLPEK